VPGLRRGDFPALDRFTYLNTASAGLVPASVVQPAHEFEAELAQAGTTGMDEDTEVGILEGAEQVDSATAVIWRAGTVTARFPGRDGEGIAAELTRQGVIVSPRVGSNRFSMHFYNSSDDVDRALAALDRVLR